MNKVAKKPQAVADLESALVRIVRSQGPISRVELARELKLVASTAGIYVDRLIERGYLIETSKATRALGRPPVMLELNPDGGRFIGVDFDARQIMTVAVDFTQQLLVQLRRTIPAHATTQRVLTTIEESIRDCIGPRQRDVLGIGLAVPGPIDAEQGISRYYKFIRDWRDVPIGSRMAESFRLPVFVENNLRSMALGELWCGQGRGLRDLVCLGIRSGIGSGIVVDGQLLHGANNLAGEIGRWVCPEELVPAPSGQPGQSMQPRQTVEDVASITALLSAAAQRLQNGAKSSLGKTGDQPTIADILSAANSGDALACTLIERAARVHGWMLHQMVALIDPQRVVVAGPLAESDAYLKLVQSSAGELGGSALESRIVRSTLGAFGGALGAAALAFHHWKPSR